MVTTKRARQRQSKSSGRSQVTSKMAGRSEPVAARTPSEPKPVRSFALSDTAHELLRALADAHGLSMSSFLEAVIRRDHKRLEVEGYVLGAPPASTYRVDGASTSGKVKKSEIIRSRD